MWLIYFVTAFNWSVTGNLTPYVISDFEAHSLVTVISIVSSVMGAALYMPIAKMLNLFDRSYGFLALVFCSIVGLITSAVCKNVETYAASQVCSPLRTSNMIWLTGVRVKLTKVGVHDGGIHRYDPKYRYPNGGYFPPPKSRSRIRLHLVSVYHHHIRRTQDCRIFPRY